MDQTSQLELLVENVLAVLRERGNSENTVIRHERAYSHLIQYAHSKGQTVYTDALIKEFLHEQEKILSTKGPRFMEQYEIAFHKLSDVAYGQEIRLRHLLTVPLKATQFDWMLPLFEEKIRRRLKNPADIKTRVQNLSLFFAHLESQNIFTLTEVNIDHIASAFANAEDKPHFRSTMREFLTYAADMKWVPVDLSSFVPKVRQHKTVPTVYSKPEIEKFLAAVDRTTRSGRRRYAALLLCARLGLRNSDVCSLEFANIDHAKQVISIVQSKTGIPLTLPLLPDVQAALNEYIEVRPESDLPQIFLRHRAPHLPLRNTTLDYELRTLLKDANINTEGKKRGTHSLRSSFASALLNEGVSYPVIQKALGHSSPNATKYYTKIDLTQLRDCALEVPRPSGNFAILLGKGVRS